MSDKTKELEDELILQLRGMHGVFDSMLNCLYAGDYELAESLFLLLILSMGAIINTGVRERLLKHFRDNPLFQPGKSDDPLPN